MHAADRSSHAAALEAELASLEPLARDLGLTAKRMRQRIESAIADEGVGGMAAWTVLVHVMLREGCSQAQLAADAGIAESTLARHLDRMVAHGLVERVPDPDDRRRQQVRSTARGRAAQAGFRRRTIAEGERMLAGISSEDRQVVRRVLAGIRHNLDRMEDAS